MALADVKINFDSTDIRSLTTWAANNNDRFNISYCYCGSDFGLLTAAVIHEVLDIPHSSINAVINGLDKNLMKNCWTKAEGINYPLSEVVNTDLDVVEAGDKWGWPLIIKPTSSSGALRLRKVRRIALEDVASGQRREKPCGSPLEDVTLFLPACYAEQRSIPPWMSKDRPSRL